MQLLKMGQSSDCLVLLTVGSAFKARAAHAVRHGWSGGGIVTPSTSRTATAAVTGQCQQKSVGADFQTPPAQPTTLPVSLGCIQGYAHLSLILYFCSQFWLCNHVSSNLLDQTWQMAPWQKEGVLRINHSRVPLWFMAQCASSNEKGIGHFLMFPAKRNTAYYDLVQF